MVQQRVPHVESHIGTKIKDARLARGMTQEQLAGAEYTKAFVSAVERGESGISDQALETFARRLEVPVEYFRISQHSFNVALAEVEKLLGQTHRGPQHAEAALQRHRTTLALRAMRDVLAPNGVLAQLHARGYQVIGP